MQNLEVLELKTLALDEISEVNGGWYYVYLDVVEIIIDWALS